MPWSFLWIPSVANSVPESLDDVLAKDIDVVLMWTALPCHTILVWYVNLNLAMLKPITHEPAPGLWMEPDNHLTRTMPTSWRSNLTHNLHYTHTYKYSNLSLQVGAQTYNLANSIMSTSFNAARSRLSCAKKIKIKICPPTSLVTINEINDRAEANESNFLCILFISCSQVAFQWHVRPNWTAWTSEGVSTSWTCRQQ
jgi:hypothetical protein